MTYRWML